MSKTIKIERKKKREEEERERGKEGPVNKNLHLTGNPRRRGKAAHAR